MSKTLEDILEECMLSLSYLDDCDIEKVERVIKQSFEAGRQQGIREQIEEYEEPWKKREK